MTPTISKRFRGFEARTASPRLRLGRACALLIALMLLIVASLARAAGEQSSVSPAGSDRVKTLGKRLLCLCGCNQILTECNHVDCPASPEMMKQLEQQVARNEPDDLTIQSFVQQYGEQVLAQPPAKGFSLMAWFMPAAAALFGLTVVRAVLRRWRAAKARAAAAPVDLAPEVLARARRQADLESEE